MEVKLADMQAKTVTGEILTGKMNAFNTFDAPENVKTGILNVNTDNGISVNIPACSVIHLTIE